MQLSWRPSQRRAILDRYFWLLSQEGSEAVWNQRAELARAYREGLPRLTLSRCPYTQFEFTRTFDPYGLDGLWWDAQAPARPRAEGLYTCRAFTGALTVAHPIESFPFLAKPGPAIPYVIPALLRDPRVTAVVSSFACGRHRAYCVAYFSPEECASLPWPNDWGSDARWAEGGATPGGWYDASHAEEHWDFEIRPHIERGKLFWIAPDDPNMATHQGLSGCPYLNLQGELRMQRLSQGELWFANELNELETEETLR